MEILRRVCGDCRTHCGCWIKNVCINCEHRNQANECNIPFQIEFGETTGICKNCFQLRKENEDDITGTIR